MRDDDYARLLEDLEHEMLSGGGPAGVLGLTRVTLRLLAVPVRPVQALSEVRHGVLVIAADEEKEDLLRESLANGYPNTLVHLYQCLASAARLGLRGAVAEFGMFKGGTTMFLSRVIERLGAA